VHPVGGGVFCYAELAGHLGADHPFFGLEMRDLPASPGELDSVEGLADRYAPEIRRACPKGPYLLGGWSFGGIVALEIARQLRSGGDPASLVVLIDPPAPGSESGEEEGEDAMVFRFARDLAGTIGLASQPLTLEGSSVRSLESVFEQARAARLLPPDAQLRDLRRRFELFRSNLRAFRRYRPHPHSERAAFILDASSPEPAGAWNFSADCQLEIHRISGDHYSLLRPPLVGAVASVLRHLVEQGRSLGKM